MSYLLCEEDQLIPPKNQRDGIEIIEKASGNKVDVTVVKVGHCPNITAEQEVVDWIVQEAGKHEDL